MTSHAWLDSLSEDWTSEGGSESSSRIANPHDLFGKMPTALSSNSLQPPKMDADVSGSENNSVVNGSVRQPPRRRSNPFAKTSATLANIQPVNSSAIEHNSNKPSSITDGHSTTQTRVVSQATTAGSTGSVLYHTTVQRNADSNQAKEPGSTPEWKRRLIHGQVEYGEQRDLFQSAATGLESMFKPPSSPSHPPPSSLAPGFGPNAVSTTPAPPPPIGNLRFARLHRSHQSKHSSSQSVRESESKPKSPKQPTYPSETRNSLSPPRTGTIIASIEEADSEHNDQRQAGTSDFRFHHDQTLPSSPPLFSTVTDAGPTRDQYNDDNDEGVDPGTNQRQGDQDLSDDDLTQESDGNESDENKPPKSAPHHHRPYLVSPSPSPRPRQASGVPRPVPTNFMRELSWRSSSIAYNSSLRFGRHLEPQGAREQNEDSEDDDGMSGSIHNGRPSQEKPIDQNETREPKGKTRGKRTRQQHQLSQQLSPNSSPRSSRRQSPEDQPSVDTYSDGNTNERLGNNVVGENNPSRSVGEGVSTDAVPPRAIPAYLTVHDTSTEALRKASGQSVRRHEDFSPIFMSPTKTKDGEIAYEPIQLPADQLHDRLQTLYQEQTMDGGQENLNPSGTSPQLQSPTKAQNVDLAKKKMMDQGQQPLQQHNNQTGASNEPLSSHLQDRSNMMPRVQDHHPSEATNQTPLRAKFLQSTASRGNESEMFPEDSLQASTPKYFRAHQYQASVGQVLSEHGHPAVLRPEQRHPFHPSTSPQSTPPSARTSMGPGSLVSSFIQSQRGPRIEVETYSDGQSVEQDREEREEHAQDGRDRNTPDLSEKATLAPPGSNGSPLKLFGPYDTFTNQILVRRISQFEEVSSPPTLTAEAPDRRRPLSYLRRASRQASRQMSGSSQFSRVAFGKDQKVDGADHGGMDGIGRFNGRDLDGFEFHSDPPTDEQGVAVSSPVFAAVVPPSSSSAAEGEAKLSALPTFAIPPPQQQQQGDLFVQRRRKHDPSSSPTSSPTRNPIPLSQGRRNPSSSIDGAASQDVDPCLDGPESPTSTSPPSHSPLVRCRQQLPPKTPPMPPASSFLHTNNLPLTPKRDACSDSKRPRQSPTKDPTPKRRRTLHKSDIAYGKNEMEMSTIASRKSSSIMPPSAASLFPAVDATPLRETAPPLRPPNISMSPKVNLMAGEDAGRRRRDVGADPDGEADREYPGDDSLDPNASLNDDQRKTSIKTQDFLHEAGKIMAMIRNQNQGRTSGSYAPGLESVREVVSPVRQQKRKSIPSDGDTDDDEEEEGEDYGNEAQQPCSRNQRSHELGEHPSLDGHEGDRENGESYTPPDMMVPEDPELLKRLQKYQELSDMRDVIHSSMRSMNMARDVIRQAQALQKTVDEQTHEESPPPHPKPKRSPLFTAGGGDQEGSIFSDPPNVRISKSPLYEEAAQHPQDPQQRYFSGLLPVANLASSTMATTTTVDSTSSTTVRNTSHDSIDNRTRNSITVPEMAEGGGPEMAGGPETTDGGQGRENASSNGNKRTIAPESVVHLIPDHVGSMYWDADRQLWVKQKKPKRSKKGGLKLKRPAQPGLGEKEGEEDTEDDEVDDEKGHERDVTVGRKSPERPRKIALDEPKKALASHSPHETDTQDLGNARVDVLSAALASCGIENEAATSDHLARKSAPEVLASKKHRLLPTSRNASWTTTATSVMADESEDDPFASIPDLSVDLMKEMKALRQPKQTNDDPAQDNNNHGAVHDPGELDAENQDEADRRRQRSRLPSKKNLTISFSSPIASIIREAVHDHASPSLDGGKSSSSSREAETREREYLAREEEDYDVHRDDDDDEDEEVRLAIIPTQEDEERTEEINYEADDHQHQLNYLSESYSFLQRTNPPSHTSLLMSSPAQAITPVARGASSSSHSSSSSHRFNLTMRTPGSLPRNPLFYSPMAQEDASAILAHQIGNLSLTPLSDFTIHPPAHEEASSYALEVSYVVGNRHIVTGHGRTTSGSRSAARGSGGQGKHQEVATTTTAKKRNLALTVKNLVEKLAAVEPHQPYWEDLQKIDLHGQQLSSLHKLEEFCGRLVTLDAAQNKLSHLDGVPSSVRHINLQHNLLHDLSSWDRLTNLQYLDVSHNELTSFSGLRHLVHLRSLRADHNRITNLDGLAHLDGLLSLRVRHNRLSGVVDLSLLDWPRLSELDVGDNAITGFLGLDKLTSLGTLKAARNQLVSLDVVATEADASSFAASISSAKASSKPLTLGREPRLLSLVRYLDVNDNRLASLDLSRLPAVRLVYADRNRISHLLGGAMARHLDTLSLREQHFAPRPSGFPNGDGNGDDDGDDDGADGSDGAAKEGRLSLDFLDDVCEVRKLYLSGNTFTSSSTLTCWEEEEGSASSSTNTHGSSSSRTSSSTVLVPPTSSQSVTVAPKMDFLNLQLLELANCGLEYLPDHLGQMMPNLRSINLNFNALSSLSCLRFIPRLKKLLVAGNRLADLTSIVHVISEFPHLGQLDLRENPITLGFYGPLLTRWASSTMSATADAHQHKIYARGDAAGGGEQHHHHRSHHHRTEEGGGGKHQRRESPELRRPRDGDSSTPSHQTPGYLQLPAHDPKHDVVFSRRLDGTTRQRRRLYEVVFAMSCARLRDLDGLPLKRSRVLAQDEVLATLQREGLLPTIRS